jgi:hypothetical protein
VGHPIGCKALPIWHERFMLVKLYGYVLLTSKACMIMANVRKGADKWLLLLFPVIFITVITAFAVVVWGADTFLKPVFH